MTKMNSKQFLFPLLQEVLKVVNKIHVNYSPK